MKPSSLNASACTLLMLLAIASTKSLHSQRLNEDSIKKVIAETKVDTTRITAMRKLASYYILHKGEDSAGLLLLRQAEQQARKINFQLGVCEILLTEGNYYRRKNDWGNAINKFEELVDQSKLIKDSFYNKRTRMMALNNLAGIYTHNGDYSKALGLYLESRTLAEALKPDFNALCLLYVNIASIYNVLDQYAKTEEYLAKCYPLLDSARPYLRYIYWQERQTLADKKKDEKMVALAIDSLEKTVSTAALSEFQKMQYMETLYAMKGKFKADYLKDYPAAIEEFEALLALAKEMNDQPETYNALYEIGNSWYRSGNNRKAITFLQDAYDGAKADSINQIVYLASKLLSDIYKQESDPARAFTYLSVAYELKDSLDTRKNLEQLNFLEASYQGEKKEKEIAELKTANTEKELAVVKRNRLLIISGIAAIGLLIVLILLYRNSRQKQVIAEKEQKL